MRGAGGTVGRGEAGDATGDLVFGRLAVPDDQAGAAGVEVVVVAGQAGHVHAEAAGLRDQSGLVGIGGQADEQVQPGLDAFRGAAGKVLGQRGAEGVAAGEVGGAGAAKVTVERACFDELGERQLVQGGRRRVTARPQLQDRGQQRAGGHGPAEPYAGAQCLADRAEVPHACRVQALQGADGPPVVAVLSVVIVFQDHPIPVAGPGQQRRAPRRGQDHAPRELMRRSDQHGARGQSLQRCDEDALAVHRDRERVKAGPAGRVAQLRPAGVFHRDAAVPVPAQHLAQQGEPVGDPGARHDVVGGGLYSAGPRQVAGQGLAQRCRAGGLPVVEPAGREPAHRLLQGAQPGAAGERRQVRQAGLEVDHDRRSRPGGDGGWPVAGGDRGRLDRDC